MRTGALTATAFLAAAAVAAAAPAVDEPGGEVVVRNDSFSGLDISVVIGDEETGIGSAPPEFSNTLYFPLPADVSTITFRARLPGARQVLHESAPVNARSGLRVRWLLPENKVEALRPGTIQG